MVRPRVSARRWLNSRPSYVMRLMPRANGCEPVVPIRPVSGCLATNLARHFPTQHLSVLAARNGFAYSCGYSIMGQVFFTVTPKTVKSWISSSSRSMQHRGARPSGSADRSQLMRLPEVRAVVVVM
jgi:hypothetical protein